MNPNYELSITRLIDIPREKLFEAWTNPELLVQWFTPKPYETIEAVIEPRAGGRFYTVMRSPEGQEFPGDGVFLEVEAPSKLVFTDAMRTGWLLNDSPFMLAIVTFEEEDGKTRYTARARHWTEEKMKEHEAMGFEAGWNAALDQLVALVG